MADDDDGTDGHERTDKLSGASSNYLELSEATWYYLKLSGAIFCYLELPRATWSYLQLC